MSRKPITDASGAVRSRTSEQERITELENDPSVWTFGHDYVLCRLCEQSIKLSGPYYLTTWHRHKYSCKEKHTYVTSHHERAVLCLKAILL